MPLQVAAQFYLVLACYISGDYRGTESVCRSLMQALQGERTPEQFGLAAFPAVVSRTFLSRTLAERGERGHEAWALRLLGKVASHQSHPDAATAEAHYRAALALADELGMRPPQAHCHRGLGTLYAKIGWLKQAHAELSTAIDLYRAMHMTFWLPPAEAALAQMT